MLNRFLSSILTFLNPPYSLPLKERKERKQTMNPQKMRKTSSKQISTRKTRLKCTDEKGCVPFSQNHFTRRPDGFRSPPFFFGSLGVSFIHARFFSIWPSAQKDDELPFVLDSFSETLKFTTLLPVHRFAATVFPGQLGNRASPNVECP